MPTLSSKSVLSLLLILSVGFSVVGCDSAGPGLKSDTSDSEQSADEESLFEATNTLDARMQTTGKSVTMTPFGVSSLAAQTASKSAPSISLTSIAQVDPPGDTTRASHLTYSSGTVYAGYKALGAPFKGGIDILDATNPTNILDVNSLGSDNVDVQEVAYDGDENALYVAAAADPSTFVGESPSLLTKVTNFSNPTTSSVGLAGKVGKSVVIAPDGDQAHDVYAVTDEKTLYRYDAGLGNEATEEVQGAEFRSVAATSDDIFTVDRAAKAYSSSVQSPGGLTMEKNISSGVGELAIGRLHARSEPVLNGTRLFLALGSEGMAVLDASSGDVLYRKSGPPYGTYYTSVTLHHDDPAVSNAPTDLVYAARQDGIIDVYRVGSNGIDAGDQSTGLEEVGTFDLSNLGGVDFAPSPQVNQVMGVGCNVYIANSNVGVVALEIGGIAGCSGGNQAPSANDDSDLTPEGQSTTTDVLANDSDSDGSLDASTVQVQSGPSDGSVSVDGSTGAITYTPDSGFTGDDSYTYTVDDGNGTTSNEATVTVTVEAFSGECQGLTVGSGSEVREDEFFDSSEDGGEDEDEQEDEDEDQAGQYAYTYEYCYQYEVDGYQYVYEYVYEWSETANQNPSPNPDPPNMDLPSDVDAEPDPEPNPQPDPPQDPTASDDTDQTDEGQSTTTDVLANDSDPDGSLDASTVTIQSSPSNGTITNVDGSTGAVTYEPDAGFTGDDTYTYTVTDNDGTESNAATVTVTVSAPSPPTPPGSNPKAISFAAFCTTQGSFNQDDVTIVEVLNKNNNPNEPVSIAWTSTTSLSTVVLKAGSNITNHPGGTSGGAASGGGTSSGQPPNSPCPNGETLIIKDEDVGDNSGADS